MNIANSIKGEASKIEERSAFVDNNLISNMFYVNLIKPKCVANENNKISKIDFV
jgi:hypothetical protein